MNKEIEIDVEQFKELPNKGKQAGAEMDQAQYKLGLYFTLIFCHFGFYRFG